MMVLYGAFFACTWIMLSEIFISVPWVLPHLSNSWIMAIIWLYIALNSTPDIDCYWLGAVPKG